jgi:general secretion pathway protein F
MEGHTLADGLGEFPKVFPEIYRSTVAAGESSGRLDNILERLADYTEAREVTRQKVLGAMLYPIVLSIVCLGIVIGMMVYVVPKVIDVFESSKGKLPFATEVLIVVSDFLRDWGIWLAIGIVLGISTASSCACRCSASWCAASTPRASRAPSASSRPAPCRCSRPCASPAKWSPIYPCATR